MDYINPIATLITGLVAIILYYWENSKKRRDIAKIILQEIRRSEEIINEYKEHNQYKFTKKIIATNSWAKNIHYFVGVLDQDELDKISNLYSTGHYLDNLIEKISDVMFDFEKEEFSKKINQIKNLSPIKKVDTETTEKSETKNIQQDPIIPLNIQIPSPGKPMLDEISNKYEPIYHSSICEKLKKIAKI